MHNRVYIEPNITDNENGTYEVRYKAPEECTCQIEVYHINEEKKPEEIRGHKFISSFSKKNTAKNTNEFDGPLMNNYLNSKLGDTAKFLESTKKNIEIRNKPITEDVKELLKVMNSLKELEDNRDDIVLSLERVKEIYSIYEKKYEKSKNTEKNKCNGLFE